MVDPPPTHTHRHEVFAHSHWTGTHAPSLQMPRPPVTRHTRDSLHQRPWKGLHLTAAMPTHTKQKETTGHTSGHFMQAGYSEERAPCSGPPPTAAASQHPASRQAWSRPAGASERHPHFSCSSAGMLMFQPMACRSKPQVNRLHTGWSSLQAEPHTIRRWPCNQAQRRQSRAQAGPHPHDQSERGP